MVRDEIVLIQLSEIQLSFCLFFLLFLVLGGLASKKNGPKSHPISFAYFFSFFHIYNLEQVKKKDSYSFAVLQHFKLQLLE